MSWLRTGTSLPTTPRLDLVPTVVSSARVTYGYHLGSKARNAEGRKGVSTHLK